MSRVNPNVGNYINYYRLTPEEYERYSFLENVEKILSFKILYVDGSLCELKVAIFCEAKRVLTEDEIIQEIIPTIQGKEIQACWVNDEKII